jgi:hypothetical protein
VAGAFAPEGGEAGVVASGAVGAVGLGPVKVFHAFPSRPVAARPRSATAPTMIRIDPQRIGRRRVSK